MGKREFENLLKLLTDATAAVRAVKEVRRKYPAGVEVLLSPSQYEAMERAEKELNEELSID